MTHNETKKRLDKIEQSLTPQQTILLGIKEVTTRFESLDDYAAYLRAHRDQPLLCDPRKVFSTYTRRLKREPADHVRKELVQTLGELASRVGLWLACNRYVANQIQAALPLLVHLAETNCRAWDRFESRCTASKLKLLLRESPPLGGDDTTAPRRPEQNRLIAKLLAQFEKPSDLNYGDDISRLLENLFETRFVSLIISDQYFDGHQILFAQFANKLNLEIDAVQPITQAYNLLLDCLQPASEGAAENGRPSPINVDRIKQAAEDSSKVLAMSLAREAGKQPLAAQANVKRADEMLRPFLEELKIRMDAETSRFPTLVQKPWLL